VSIPDRHFNDAVDDMLRRLDVFRHSVVQPDSPPAPPAPAHPSTLVLLEAVERPVGVGNWQGNVERGAVAVLGVRGGRVEARVRFDLWAADAAAAADATLQLQRRIRDARLGAGMRDFLVLEPAGGDPAQRISDGEGWRQTVEYRVLFEYSYEDPEGAGSVIVRIPVDVRGEHHEDAVVTRDVARWDREGAAPLVVRGPRTVGTLTLLWHTGAGLPAGTVTLLRTHAGAQGPPESHDDPGGFEDALRAGGRHVQLKFDSLKVFKAAFTSAGAAVRLAGLEEDPVADFAALEPGPALGEPLAAVRLADAGERFEVAWHDPDPAPGEAKVRFPGDSTAVMYLRVGRGFPA
jgi:hypothetical protein